MSQDKNANGSKTQARFLIEIVTFLAVVQTGSYKDALQVLTNGNPTGENGKKALTTRALQARVERLEKYLSGGVALFARERKVVETKDSETGEVTQEKKTLLVPSAAGARFLKYAYLMEKLWDRARDEVARFQAYSGVIVVGSQFSLLDHIARHFLSVMREKHEDVAVSFKVYKSDELVRSVRENVIDIALVYDESDRGGLRSEPFADEILVLVSTSQYVSHGQIERGNYIYIDYGPAFFEWHQTEFHDSDEMSKPFAHFDRAGPALRYIRENEKAVGYVPYRMARRYIDEKELFVVPKAPAKKRKIFLVSRKEEPQVELPLAGNFPTGNSLTDYIRKDRGAREAIILEARVIFFQISEKLESEWAQLLGELEGLGVKAEG